MKPGTTARGNVEAAAQSVMLDRGNDAAPPPQAPTPPPTPKLRSANSLPPGFGDSVKEIKYEAREADAFGALDVGDVVIQGGPADAGSGAAEVVVEDKKPDGEGEVGEGEGTAPELEAKDDETTTEPELAPEKPTIEPQPTRAAQRREKLDALKSEARNRSLSDQLEAANRRAVEAEQRERAATERAVADVQRLKGADLAERLQFLGVETKEELLELAITGKLNLPEVRPEPAKKPDETPERLAALEAELKTYRGQTMLRDLVAAEGMLPHFDAIAKRASDQWTADGRRPGTEVDYIKAAVSIERWGQAFAAELATSDALDIPLARAIPGQLDAIKEAALGLWKENGFRAGEHSKYLQKASDLAEEMLREAEAPKFKALGFEMPARRGAAAPKPAVLSPPPVGASAPKVPPKPAAPVGKRVAARGPALDDDGLPLDGAQRDAIIKRDMQKAGHKGWGSSL